MKAIHRICIYPKDIVRITGRSERFSRNLMNKIRAHIGKSNDQFVTALEFCQYTGLDPEEIVTFLLD